MLIIGSQALAYRRALYPGREVGPDTDIICTWGELEDLIKIYPIYYPFSDKKWVLKNPDLGCILECEIAWEGSTAESIWQGGVRYASLEILLALKLSHRYLRNSPHFLKTMRDIQHLRNMGVTLGPAQSMWLRDREKETLWYEHPNLNRTKAEFFTPDVPYKYDHDSIHKAVAIGDWPAYMAFQKDGAEVMCDMDKFESLPMHIRQHAVWEESAVLALERSLIPFPNGWTAKRAFEFALQKVCTSITSGRFREFAWENYDAVLTINSVLVPTLMERFEAGLANGVIKPHED